MTLAEQTMSKRGGRPRRTGVDRYDNGRIREDPARLPKWNKARDLFLEIGGAHRLSTQRGKLFCLRQITDIEFEAANRWADLLEDNDRIFLGRRRSPSPPSLERMGASADSEFSEERIRRFREKFNAAHAMLLTAGKVAEAAVNKLCRDETAGAMLPDARKGLAVLAVHFGLVKGKR